MYRDLQEFEELWDQLTPVQRNMLWITVQIKYWRRRLLAPSILWALFIVILFFKIPELLAVLLIFGASVVLTTYAITT